MHLVKNNWLTETTSELSFKDETFSTKWSDLVQLYKLEEQLHQSGLIQVQTVYPNIYDQNFALDFKKLNRKRVNRSKDMSFYA